MDENQNTQNNTQPESMANSPPPETVVGAPLQPSQPPEEPKRRGKKTLILIVLLIALLAGGATYYFGTKKTTVPSASVTNTVPKLSLSNQPKQLNDQFSTANFTAGYVRFKSTALKTVDKALPALDPLPDPVTGSSDKQVVFINDLNYNGAQGHRLLMYDVDSKTTYLVAQADTNGRYDNARIMSDHYIVFAETVEIDPTHSNTNIKVVDLQTGDSQTIMSGKASEVPVSLCCSVTKDGLRLVIPQTNKFLIYQAGDTQPVTFNADVSVFPQVQGNGGGDYEAAQRNYGYPSIEWLNDDEFMYATAHPLKWTVDSQGSHAATNNNSLAIFNLQTGKSTKVKGTGTGPINWFNADGDSITFSVYGPNVSGVVDKNSGLTILKMDNYHDASPLAVEELAIPLDDQSKLFYDSASKKLYIQPSSSGLNEDITMLNVLDTTTGKTVTKKISSPYKAVDLQGFIGKDQAVLGDSFSLSSDYYIYDMGTDKTQLIMTVGSPSG